MTTPNVVAAIISVLIIAGSVWVGINYVTQNSVPNKQDKLVIKQKMVKKNRQIFGISDVEAADIKDVNIVKYDDLGING